HNDSLGKITERPGNDSLRLSKQHQPAHFLSDLLPQNSVVATLVHPTGQQDDRVGKTRQRFHDGTDIGSFGIVIVANPVFLPHELKSMFETGEILKDLLDRRRGDAGRFRRRSEEHTSELQSRFDLVCRLLLEMLVSPYTYTLSLHDALPI